MLACIWWQSHVLRRRLYENTGRKHPSSKRRTLPMTPKAISASTILQLISEESMGFRFGKPERPNEASLACILPILRETSQERQYITLPETEQVLVFDSGTINKVNLKNTSKKNVFVRSGTIF